MKCIWEESDIKAGVRYNKPGTIEIHMIGYMADRDDRRYVSISLSDGLVQPPRTRNGWALDLTENGYAPVHP